MHNPAMSEDPLLFRRMGGLNKGSMKRTVSLTTPSALPSSGCRNAAWDNDGSNAKERPRLFLNANDVLGGSISDFPGQQLPDFPMRRNGSYAHVHACREDDVEQVDVKLMAKPKGRPAKFKIHDDPNVVAGYASVPLIEIDRLPRGGISLETKAVGRIQFGIPPETIKDSMRLGLNVPRIYIVPVERFCREMGPALGINLAEFEFPAYFNYFMKNKRCTLIVDSNEAESDIRAVFGETLLGPAQFRDHDSPRPHEDEDFDPAFPKLARPNFYKEFYHFRTAEQSSGYQELTIDMLLDFCHFRGNQDICSPHEGLGEPPKAADVAEVIATEMEQKQSTRGRRITTFDESHRQELPAIAGIDVTDESVSSEEGSRHGRRRTFSDPDLSAKLAALTDIMNHPGSPVADGASNGSPQFAKGAIRRGSLDSTGSIRSRASSGMSWSSPGGFLLTSDEEDEVSRPWMYSQLRWLGDVATVYPPDATPEQRRSGKIPRVEIFKMTGGTEYVVHDVDENNIIIGKARFSGTVHVPDEMAVEGFLSREASNERRRSDGDNDAMMVHCSNAMCVPRSVAPPTFHPPSFGVTVLGNSHGFDKDGATSGYVLWINGRGIMIDPPPYSSATLELEGIRPQMIVAIMITHCHADHDAGAFQKVMTGARVAIITTPTIYKSFIRKYAALSGLSTTLLRHSHRHRPAIIGQPLKFQGAKFHFTYTLHTIPCIAFKVEWRGRSMVFTGDHLNNPAVLDALEKKGVVTKERADDLRSLPLQECDALLHEAGAPPIHTPLAVLKALPDYVKERLYVVHTSALPPDCGLRVAPTGTSGTIRLDQRVASPVAFVPSSSRKELEPGLVVNGFGDRQISRNGVQISKSTNHSKTSEFQQHVNPLSVGKSVAGTLDFSSLDDGGYPNVTVVGNYLAPDADSLTNYINCGKFDKQGNVPPLVFLRPTCVSDAWFILNLLSAVPFFSSLSYANTMEVLEIAQVEMFCQDEVVIPGERRSELLCVVWEGTCVEVQTETVEGPVSINFDHIQLKRSKSLEVSRQDLTIGGNVLIESDEIVGRKPTVWHAGDWTGPVSLQPDADRSAESSGGEPRDIVAVSAEGVKVILLNMKDLNRILKNGSKLFRKYLVIKERQDAAEAETKALIARSESSSSVDFSERCATVLEEPSSRMYSHDSILEVLKCNSALGKLTALQKRHLESLAEGPRYFEQDSYLWKVGDPVEYAFLIVSGTACFASKPEADMRNRRGSTGTIVGSLSPVFTSEEASMRAVPAEDKLLLIMPTSEYARLEIGLQLRVEEMELDVYDHDHARDLSPKEERMRRARDRFANKVLARLYSRRAYTAGLIFSRGHFLADTSRMVSDHIKQSGTHGHKDSATNAMIVVQHCHTSNIVAGSEGCVVMIFPRSSLVPFLDSNPGVLLSLLGTQVVV